MAFFAVFFAIGAISSINNVDTRHDAHEPLSDARRRTELLNVSDDRCRLLEQHVGTIH